jgi:hypothetical protein
VLRISMRFFFTVFSVAIFSVAFQFTAVTAHGQSSTADPPGVHVERVAPSMIFVAVDRKDLALAELLGWARQIRAANPSHRSGRIGFFTSRRAARTFTMNSVVDPPPHLAESSREFLAMYDLENGMEYLTVFPFGYRADFKYVRVPIESAKRPHCGFHVAERCLLSLDPLRRDETGVVGSVVLEARTTRAGKLERIRVAVQRDSESEQQDRLARIALANAKTWLLESGQEQQVLRITYSFGNAVAQKNSGSPELALNAPGGVKIFAEVVSGR